MRIVTISRVKNEADIVEAFVRHTLSLSDHLLVIDHGSTDDTLRILKDLKSSGLSLDIVKTKESDVINHPQAEHMTSLMREAFLKHGADWVLPLDADEFIIKDKNELIEILKNTRTDKPSQICWKTYVPDTTDDQLELNPALRLRHHLAVESRPWFKVIVPKQLASLPDINLSPGNHSVMKGAQLLEALTVEETQIAHFPVRSIGQYASKVVIAYLRYNTIPNRNLGLGFHYNYPFELLKNSFAIFSNNINELARQYCVLLGQEFFSETVLEPIPYQGGKLKFTQNYDTQQAAISNILAFAEKIAQEVSRLSSIQSLHSIPEKKTIDSNNDWNKNQQFV